MKSIRILGLFSALFALCVMQAQAETGHFDRTLQVSGTVDLEITSGAGNITVHTGGNGNVHVGAKIHARDFWMGMSASEKIRRIEANPPIEQQGNTIRIGKIEDRDLQRNVSIDYDVIVPPQTKLVAQTGSGDQTLNGLGLPLTAKTGSGNVTVENIGGEVHASSGSGDLKITSVKGSLNAGTGSGSIHAIGIGGAITASTGSGSIDVEQVAPGNVKVESGSGGIKVRGLKGSLRADTGSGDIRAEGEPTGDWRIGAGSGSIDLKIPSQSSFNLDARTSSGRLTVNHPVTSQGSFSHSHVQGKVGSGGALLDVHTGSGDIQID
ncbi:MAG TPA: DUF4097 family beta strand repeat-containing protein [Candidatus Angelobacter sp.]|nr:DUF4097 family beta strand repeat-containing protein [Candidatus Angelobacter sp.]